MAKLKAPSRAGFTAGQNYYSKQVKTRDIIVDPEVSKLFTQSDAIRDGIREQIEKFGFDKNQPLAVAVVEGKKFLVDGHTRLAAAKEARLEEVPVTEIEFPDFDQALMYSFERQSLRRNLTGAEILAAAQMIKGPKVKDGTGRAGDLLAKKLRVSPATVYQARKVAAEASEDVIKAVQKGEMSLKAGYTTVKATSDHIPESSVPDARGLPAAVKFLKSAVEILYAANGEYSRLTVIHLLINHFIRKKEKPAFLKLLSPDVREGLDDESDAHEKLYR